MAYHIARILHSTPETWYTTVHGITLQAKKRESMPEILRNIHQQSTNLEVVSKFLRGNGAVHLSRSRDVLGASKRILFAGLGGSKYAAMSTALYLSRFGYDARVADASELLYYEQFQTDAAIVLISRSGRTAEMVRLARILNDSGRRYVAVTNEPDSEMAQLASATLPVAGESDNGVSIRTYTAAVLTLLHLGASLAGKMKTLRNETAKMLPNLERMIANWEEDDTDLSQLSFFCFLGRGYSLGCAAEAALLFQELARRPAAWYNSAEFRQGPIEVLQPDHGVIVFAPDGPTRELNTALVRELELTGARVIEIGPAWVALPEYMASIVQMIPVQFMAYKLAAATPHRPGVFRFASATTESETKVAVEQ